MQIICTSLQTDNHASSTSLSNFFQVGCCSWCPTNSIKALKAVGYWFVGSLIPASSFQQCSYCSTKLLLFIHSHSQSVNLNQQSTVKTAHMNIHIMHNCRTQYSTEQFSQSSLLSSAQCSLLRCCLLDGRGLLSNKVTTINVVANTRTAVTLLNVSLYWDATMHFIHIMWLCTTISVMSAG